MPRLEQLAAAAEVLSQDIDIFKDKIRVFEDAKPGQVVDDAQYQHRPAAPAPASFADHLAKDEVDYHGHHQKQNVLRLVQSAEGIESYAAHEDPEVPPYTRDGEIDDQKGRQKYEYEL